METITNLQYISIDELKEPADPVRSEMSDKSLDELVESIKAVGIINPLIIKKSGNGFEVVAGHRRFLAAKMANFVKVPFILLDTEKQNDVVIKLHENFCREEVNPIDEAFVFSEMATKHNMNIGEIAKTTKRSENYINNKIDILSWPKDIREALHQGRIKYTVAKYLARITDDNQRIEYLGYAISSGITSRIAQTWSEDFKRGELTPKVEERIEEDIKTGETKIIPYITCQLCGEDIEMGNQKLIFVHEKCIEEYKKMFNS